MSLCPHTGPLQPPFPILCLLVLQIMEVASPTAGSVLVELSQLQLLQVCSEVAVRTMSPHGESADSFPAPVAPALAAAYLQAKVSCPSPRPGLEARTPLAPAAPGPGDPSSPLQCPDPHRTQEPPGGLPASPPRETPKGPQVEPPAPCSQVPCWEEGEQVEAGGGAGPFLSICHFRRRLGNLCRVPQRTEPVSQLRVRELALHLPPWPSRRPGGPREHWPRGYPVLRPATEATRELG